MLYYSVMELVVNRNLLKNPHPVAQCSLARK